MIGKIFLNLLFPPRCVLCGGLLEKNETDFCTQCRCDSPECRKNKLKLPFLDSWVAVWYYKGCIRESLHRYKFGRRRHYAQSYGRALAMRLLQEYPEGFDVLTWVPVSPLRKLTRGFDQVELICRAVGRELGMEPVRLLKKVRHNRPQSGIGGDARRRANVINAYRPVHPELAAGKRILLLDDIVTTGATAGECARVLLTAGAESICLGCVASAHQGK